MERKERIELTDTSHDILFKMSDGNPGAINVLVQIMKEGARIDLDSFSGGLSSMLTLDSLGIYGSNIWLLYKDVCGEDVIKVIAVLRSVGLGFLTREKLLQAIESRSDINVDDLYKQVKEFLPNFNRS